MNKLFILSALFFLAALIFQFRHELSTSTDGMSDEGRRAKHSLEKFSYELFSDGKPYSGGESYSDALSSKKAVDQPVVFMLYGAAILFLFGGVMKSQATNQEEKSQTTPSE